MPHEFTAVESTGLLSTPLLTEAPPYDLPLASPGLHGLEDLPALLGTVAGIPTIAEIAPTAVLAGDRSPFPTLSAPALIGDELVNEPTVGTVWQASLKILDTFTQSPDSEAVLTRSFGDRATTPAAQQVIDEVLRGQRLPKLSVLPSERLAAEGAYAAKTGTIFLAKELLGHPERAIRVLLEELGHFLDDQINQEDTAGDEGALFSSLVLGDRLTEAAIAALQQEDDSALLTLNGQSFAVEQASFGPGTLTVDGSGQVTVEFVADSGSYQSQVALFSLTGMEGLTPGSPAFIQEAARRALSNSPEGYVVINDIADGATLEGELGEANRNAGAPAGSRTVAFNPGAAIAVMLVPNGTVAEVFNNPGAEGSLRPLFSVASANPNQQMHMGEIRPGLFAMEDIRFDTGSDGDFNDVIFSLQGVTGQIEAVTELAGSTQIWLDTPLGRQLLLVGNNPLFPPPNLGNLQVAIPTGVPKFNATSLEADIIASGAASITVGTQTIYIGTNQVAANNQNPIIRSFDSANPANNWTRTDYEVTGADGRGVGLAWDGTNLYGVFTVDGTQGTAAQDFRRESQDAQQAWLRSYGQGGGAKVSVLGRINPANGELLDAAYLSALLSNGDSNTLTVTDIGTNANGNLVVSTQSFFSPRRPDGSALTQVTPGSSPFAYAIEITPDLKRVVSTAAPGWA